MESELLIDDRDGVRTLTLNRPESLNALTDNMRAGIAVAVRDFEANEDLRALVLTGSGRGFCSGADLSGQATTAQEPKRPSPRFWWHLPFEETNKPTICALNGAAAGGGIGLALSCDLIIASSTARIHPAFLAIALSPDNGISQKIVQRIGYPRSLSFFLGGKPLTSSEALAIGLIDRIAEPEDLQTTARDLALEYAALPPVAVALTKRLLKQALHVDRANSLILEEAAIGLARQTQDAAEGALAFRERRKPVWKGY